MTRAEIWKLYRFLFAFAKFIKRFWVPRPGEEYLNSFATEAQVLVDRYPGDFSEQLMYGFSVYAGNKLREIQAEPQVKPEGYDN
ncbi:MAG: hypothetical protein LUG62_08840 [Clostridiales bacterium]|nr:hypothetical protein [Clostridiales bacterium]